MEVKNLSVSVFRWGGVGVVLTFYFEDVCNRLRNKFVAFNVFPHRM